MSRYEVLRRVFAALSGREWNPSPEYTEEEECEALLDTINDYLHDVRIVLGGENEQG